MDGERFDDLARILALGVSRRQILKLLAGGTAAIVSAATRWRDVSAKALASVQTGGQKKFCLGSVEVSDQGDPKRGEFGTGINIPWMKKHFRAEVFGCRKHPDDTFLLRTATSYLFWVQTRSGEWKLFKYGDKPIE